MDYVSMILVILFAGFHHVLSQPKQKRDNILTLIEARCTKSPQLSLNLALTKQGRGHDVLLTFTHKKSKSVESCLVRRYCQRREDRGARNEKCICLVVMNTILDITAYLAEGSDLSSGVEVSARFDNSSNSIFNKIDVECTPETNFGIEVFSKYVVSSPGLTVVTMSVEFSGTVQNTVFVMRWVEYESLIANQCEIDFSKCSSYKSDAACTCSETTSKQYIIHMNVKDLRYVPGMPFQMTAYYSVDMSQRVGFFLQPYDNNAQSGYAINDYQLEPYNEPKAVVIHRSTDCMSPQFKTELYILRLKFNPIVVIFTLSKDADVMGNKIMCKLDPMNCEDLPSNTTMAKGKSECYCKLVGEKMLKIYFFFHSVVYNSDKFKINAFNKIDLRKSFGEAHGMCSKEDRIHFGNLTEEKVYCDTTTTTIVSKFQVSNKTKAAGVSFVVHWYSDMEHFRVKCKLGIENCTLHMYNDSKYCKCEEEAFNNFIVKFKVYKMPANTSFTISVFSNSDMTMEKGSYTSVCNMTKFGGDPTVFVETPDKPYKPKESVINFKKMDCNPKKWVTWIDVFLTQLQNFNLIFKIRSPQTFQGVDSYSCLIDIFKCSNKKPPDTTSCSCLSVTGNLVSVVFVLGDTSKVLSFWLIRIEGFQSSNKETLQPSEGYCNPGIIGTTDVLISGSETECTEDETWTSVKVNFLVVQFDLILKLYWVKAKKLYIKACLFDPKRCFKHPIEKTMCSCMIETAERYRVTIKVGNRQVPLGTPYQLNIFSSILEGSIIFTSENMCFVSKAPIEKPSLGPYNEKQNIIYHQYTTCSYSSTNNASVHLNVFTEKNQNIELTLKMDNAVRDSSIEEMCVVSVQNCVKTTKGLKTAKGKCPCSKVGKWVKVIFYSNATRLQSGHEIVAKFKSGEQLTPFSSTDGNCERDLRWLSKVDIIDQFLYCNGSRTDFSVHLTFQENTYRQSLTLYMIWLAKKSPTDTEDTVFTLKCPVNVYKCVNSTEDTICSCKKVDNDTFEIAMAVPKTQLPPWTMFELTGYYNHKPQMAVSDTIYRQCNPNKLRPAKEQRRLRAGRPNRKPKGDNKSRATNAYSFISLLRKEVTDETSVDVLYACLLTLSLSTLNFYKC